jgi:hypothetical protein
MDLANVNVRICVWNYRYMHRAGKGEGKTDTLKHTPRHQNTHQYTKTHTDTPTHTCKHANTLTNNDTLHTEVMEREGGSGGDKWNAPIGRGDNEERTSLQVG